MDTPSETNLEQNEDEEKRSRHDLTDTESP